MERHSGEEGGGNRRVWVGGCGGILKCGRVVGHTHTH